MNKLHTVARDRGFSLVEVALATAIIGVGVSALLMSVGAGTRVNDDAQKLTQASFLAGEVREWASNLSYDTLCAQASPATYSPPHDGNGNAITGMTGWSQKVTITWRDPNNISVPSAGVTDVANVGIRVSYNGYEHLVSNFLVTRRQ
jgi:prepilin-type N-terminal cleavage/methylation domain-containing protein